MKRKTEKVTATIRTFEWDNATLENGRIKIFAWRHDERYDVWRDYEIVLTFDLSDVIKFTKMIWWFLRERRKILARKEAANKNVEKLMANDEHAGE